MTADPGVSHPTMTRIAAFILVGVLLLLIVGPIALFMLAGVRDTVEATPHAMASEPPAAQPATIEEAAWWRLSFDQLNQGPSVDVGTLGAGRTANVELRQRIVENAAFAVPNRRAVGPRHGTVVVIDEDGPESVLSAVEAASGERREILRSDELIIDAAFADGTTLVFLTADLKDGAPIDVWRVDVAAPAAPVRIEGLVAERPPVRLVAMAAWITRLVVSVEGDVVGVLRCELDACALRSVNLESGEERSIRLAFLDQPVAITDGVVVLQPACVDVDCRVELLDLASGARQPIPGDGSSFVRIAVIDGMLITDAADFAPVQPGRPRVARVLRVREGGDGVELPVDLGWMEIISTPDFEFGVELSPEWFVVRGSPPPVEGADPPPMMKAYAVRASDGKVVPLPALGDWFIQG